MVEDSTRVSGSEPYRESLARAEGIHSQRSKAQTKDDLISGIKQFWRKVDTQKCQKYIGHLKKVIPKVIEVQGAASGY